MPTNHKVNIIDCLILFIFTFESIYIRHSAPGHSRLEHFEGGLQADQKTKMAIITM